MPRLSIDFMNGSNTEKRFPSAIAARRYARQNISYSGGRICAVYLLDHNSSETLWSHDWDDVSKAAGLADCP